MTKLEDHVYLSIIYIRRSFFFFFFPVGPPKRVFMTVHCVIFSTYQIAVVVGQRTKPLIRFHCVFRRQVSIKNHTRTRDAAFLPCCCLGFFLLFVVQLQLTHGAVKPTVIPGGHQVTKGNSQVRKINQVESGKVKI